MLCSQQHHAINQEINTNVSMTLPPPSKRRRIDPTDNSMDDLLNFVDAQPLQQFHFDASTILDTKEILEEIHSYLEIHEILSSRLVCKAWNESTKIRIESSQLTPSGIDCDLFPLFIRDMFESSIGKFEQWLLFFIAEYKNASLKLKLNLKSGMLYPSHRSLNPGGSSNSNSSSSSNTGSECEWRPAFPEQTPYNCLPRQPSQRALYQQLLCVFMHEQRRTHHISLHNILFAWLRGLKPLSLQWLRQYRIEHLRSDLLVFHKQLSSDYIEPEVSSIPLLKNVCLTRYDYMSSFLGLMTLNGDFTLFTRLHEKIAENAAENGGATLTELFPRQHHVTHVYQHLHTFCFAYNVFGLCHTDLFATALRICDIPRSVCSLKVIRFVLLPHILVGLQADLALHKYPTGNILSVPLWRRLRTLQSFCFHFDLCATIHSSNLNRSDHNDFLIYSQIKKPFQELQINVRRYSIDTEQDRDKDKDKDMDKDKEHEQGQILSNYDFWKRYMLLCHLRYFLDCYQERCDVCAYIQVLFESQPCSISSSLWMVLLQLVENVAVLYPALKDILYGDHRDRPSSDIGAGVGNGAVESAAAETIVTDADAAVDEVEDDDNDERGQSYRMQSQSAMRIEHDLREHYDEYVSVVSFLDCIGAVYLIDENRILLRNIKGTGPTSKEQYDTFKQCVLASPEIRSYYVAKYDLQTLYNAILHVSRFSSLPCT